jgi:transcriptional regulator with XRE-family HTH domain
MHMREINPLGGSPTADEERKRAQKVIAANVRVELARANVSGSQMATKIGLPTSTFNRRVAGEVSFDAEELAAVAAVLEISTDVLLADVVTVAESAVAV